MLSRTQTLTLLCCFSGIGIGLISGCGRKSPPTVAETELLKDLKENPRPADVAKAEPAERAPVAERLLEDASESFKLRFHNTSMILEISPDNPKPHIEMARMFRDTAFQRLTERKERDFQDMMLESAKFARKAIATDRNIEQFRLELGDIFYGEASALSSMNQAEAAWLALRQALSLGFRNMQLIDNDPSLAPVRELKSFQEKRSEIEAEINMFVIDDAVADLRNGSSFAFELEALDLKDNIQRLGDYRGKVVMVDLYSSLNQMSRVRLDSFVELQSAFRKKGLQMIGLNYEAGKPDEAIAAARKVIRDKKINYPCAIGTKEMSAQIPGFRILPTTVLLDRTGKVRMTIVGVRPKLYYQTVIELLLNESAETSDNASEKVSP